MTRVDYPRIKSKKIGNCSSPAQQYDPNVSLVVLRYALVDLRYVCCFSRYPIAAADASPRPMWLAVQHSARRHGSHILEKPIMDPIQFGGVTSLRYDTVRFKLLSHIGRRCASVDLHSMCCFRTKKSHRRTLRVVIHPCNAVTVRCNTTYICSRSPNIASRSIFNTHVGPRTD